MHNTKLSGYSIRIQFDNSVLVVEQSKYATKIVNAYIFYDLDDWPKIHPSNFKLKNSLFDATDIVKNSHKDKWVRSGYGLPFDRAGSWGFGNDFARNLVIFGVDNSSSSHAENCKTSFLILGETPTGSIHGSIGEPENKFSISFSKKTTRFCLSLH